MQSPEEPHPATGYVLLTHGPKHTAAPLERRPGAWRQLTMIRNYARQFGFRLERIAFDHVRAAEELADFETLSRLLEQSRSGEGPSAIILDDVERLLRRVPFGTVEPLAMALRQQGDLIHDANLGRRLDRFDERFWIQCILGAQKRMIGSEIVRRLSPPQSGAGADQTDRARAKSAQERARRADEAAQAIVALRDELRVEACGGEPTLDQIALTANARGLRTSRGSVWPASSVWRALKRLAKLTEDE